MDIEELKAVFHRVAEHEQPHVKWDWEEGVCFNINKMRLPNELRSEVEHLMDEWAGSNSAYPVPASPDALHGQNDDLCTPNVLAFYTPSTDCDLYTGTYGRSRREMCRYIAENLK